MRMNSNKMKLIVQLKPIEQLKSLPTFSHNYDNYLLFKDDSIITSDMVDKCNVELTWAKKLKSFVDNDSNTYSLDWLTNITVSDDKLKLGLEINDCDLTVRILEMDESLRNKKFAGETVYKSFKDKLRITSMYSLYFEENRLCIHGESLKDLKESTHTFNSPKQLTKWIRMLIKVK